MKTIITIVLTLIVGVPVISYAMSGMVEYQTVKLKESFGQKHVTKIYDHDESIVCYISSGLQSTGISCLRDN